MIKLKRSAGHVEMDIGEATLYLTYDQAKVLGNHLIMMGNPQVLEITLEPDQYRDVSEDGTVKEPSKRSFTMSTMSRPEQPKSE